MPCGPRRRRVHDDQGFSLVEVLVAVVVIGVALLALMTGFVASAQSLQNQRLRSDGVRVATQELERLRAKGYDDPDLAVGGPTTSTATADGRSFQVARTVTLLDAAPDNAVTTDVIKTVTVRVSWTVGGAGKQVTLTTAVAPDPDPSATTPTGTIGDATVSPSTARVHGTTGATIEPVTFSVPLTGFPVTQFVTLTWTDDDGPHSRTVSYDAATEAWVTTFAAGEIRAVVPAGETRQLSFTAYAGSVSRAYSVSFQRVPTSPLSITSTSIAPATIWVARSNNCNPPTQCRNVAAVTFTADVDGFDTTRDIDSVRVRYALEGGAYQEVGLQRSATTLTRWSYTVPAQTVQFDSPGVPGTLEDRTFKFVALRSDDQAKAEVDDLHPVGMQ